MDAITDWAKLLGVGSAMAAFVVLVRMFLQRQKESDQVMMQMRDSNHDDMKETREAFSKDLKETHLVFTTQLQSVTDRFTEQHAAQMRVNVETVAAINGLRQDVHALKDKV